MIEQIKNGWEDASERDQKLVLILACVIIVAVIYFAFWKPLANDLANNQQQLKNAQQTLQWVEKNAAKLVQAGANSQSKVQPKANLSQLVNRIAKQKNITISRIQTRAGQVDIWIKEVEFNAFIDWLSILKNKYNVQVNSVDLNRDKISGIVKVNRLALSY